MIVVTRANASSDLVTVPEHIATEKIIRDSGMTFTFLRHGPYHESFAASVKKAVQTDGFVGSAGEGHENKTHELAAP